MIVMIVLISLDQGLMVSLDQNTVFPGGLT